MKAGDRTENAASHKPRATTDNAPMPNVAAQPVRRPLGAIENVMQAQQRRGPSLPPVKEKGWNKSIRAAPLQRGAHRTLHVSAQPAGIPMYDPAALRQAEGLYILPAAARRQDSASASACHPPAEPDAPPSTPRGGAALPTSSGASSSFMAAGAGPVELADLYEQGPGWRRSASRGGVGRVQVASRTSSGKGGGAVSRVPWADSAVK